MTQYFPMQYKANELMQYDIEDRTEAELAPPLIVLMIVILMCLMTSRSMRRGMKHMPKQVPRRVMVLVERFRSRKKIQKVI